MKKSELKKYIKENIISELSEDKETQQNAKDTEELTKAVEDLSKAKKEAGIEEKVANSSDDVIDPAEYGDIGKGYLSGFNKPHSLNDDDLETLGRKIVKQLYKGDFDSAKAKFIKEDLREGNFDELKKYQKMLRDAADFYRNKAENLGLEPDLIQAFNKGINDLEDTIFDEDNKRSGGKIDENIGLADLEEIGYTDGDKAVNMHFNQDVVGINSDVDYKSYRKGFIQGVIDSTQGFSLDENEDAEPTKSDIKKTKGLAKAKEELALLTREMKSLAKKYSKAEGADKEKLVKILKDKTKLKKELESILDNKKI